MAEVEQLLEQFAELEAELQHIREELTHSHRLATLGTLTSTIAHEYNNILTPMISYAQLALANPEDRDLTHKAVEKALAGAQRAAQISSSLLGFAREEQDIGPAALREVVDEAISCMARPPEKDGLTLHVEVPNVHLAMSALNLQQVLMNLILNARKAMRRTGGHLYLRGQVERDHFKLEVRDTGPGIPLNIQQRLFDPFVTSANHLPTEHVQSAPGHGNSNSNGNGNGASQTGGAHASHAAPQSPTVEHKGTGLGLCICRDLLRRAHGDITVSSTPGQGATFHLTIPLADEGDILTT